MATPVTSPETVPSLDALWDTFRAAQQMRSLMRYDQQLRWRIGERDWAWMTQWRSDSPWGQIVRDTIDVKGVRIQTLFDVPVEFVRAGRFGSPPHWPELVIVCDRRN